MKKVFLLIVSLILAISLIACGGASTDTLYVLSYKPEYQAYFNKVNDIFLEENPEIKKIDFKSVDTNDYNTILNSKIQSKTLDVFLSESIYMMQGSANYMLELEEKPYFNEINPYFMELGQYYDSSIDDEPRQLTIPIENVGSVVFYNKTIFDEYGLEEPTTWSEFVSLLDFFEEKKDRPDQGKTKIADALMFGGKSEWPSLNILNAIVADTIELNHPTFFSDIKNYETNPNIRFNNDAWISALTKLRTIGEAINPILYGVDYSAAPLHFLNGRQGAMYPMMIDGTWTYTSISDAQFELGAFILPAEEDTVNAEGKKNFATKPGVTVSVFKDSNKSVLAQKYLEIMFRDEVYSDFLELTGMPSVKTTISQSDEFIQSIFDETKYTYVPMYDSRMPRYFPLTNAADLIYLMQGHQTPEKVANDLQTRIDATKEDWMEFIHLSHRKED